MDDISLIILTLARMILPLTILKWPLPGVIACMTADVFDYNMLSLSGAEDYVMYQTWDKVLDLYYLSFAAYLAWSWKDAAAKKLALFLFAYRAAGVLLLLITHERFFLFVFPNVFESFFIFYLLFKAVEKKQRLFNSSVAFVVIFVGLLTPKLVQEFYIHVSPTLKPFYFDIASLQFVTGVIPELLLAGALYLLLPLTALGWRLRHRTPKRLQKALHDYLLAGPS